MITPAKYPYFGEASNAILSAIDGPTNSEQVAERTGLPRKQIADYLARHTRAGILCRVRRGVYVHTSQDQEQS